MIRIEPGPAPWPHGFLIPSPHHPTLRITTLVPRRLAAYTTANRRFLMIRSIAASLSLALLAGCAGSPHTVTPATSQERSVLLDRVDAGGHGGIDQADGTWSWQ